MVKLWQGKSINGFQSLPKDYLVYSRTFKIERITIFIFSFCTGLVTQLNGGALEV